MFDAPGLMGARIDHGDQEVKGGVCVAHNKEQRRLLVIVLTFAFLRKNLISQGVQLQFIVHGDLPQLLDVKGGEPCAAGNIDALSCFACDELSRTF